MAYNNLVSRTDAGALIPEEVSRDMIRRATEDSATLRLFRKVPVGRSQVRFPVLSALPVAYFVNGDTGLKQTTEVNWANKYLNIEEIAAIVPVPDNVVADVELDIWDEMMPYLVEAFYRCFDSAVFFGTNAPGTWPTNIAAAAAAAGNAVTVGTATAAQGGFMGDFDATIATIEADGFDMTGVVAARTARARLRAARDTTGQKTDVGRVNGALTEIDGAPIVYPMRGLWPTGVGTPLAFAGDWSNFVAGVRQDITMKVLTEAVIQDNTGQIIYNLAQQDMTALRLTFRVGWQVANLLNYDQPTEGNRYPVARLNNAS
ncbi:phage capsid protein [Actinoplanes italicus]|uniref:HK97 family phage major capsid protein n=1 Tax=Actinoplanes italicus TaxID=113567 RepID=A0A2T0KJF2_9ACTN|nr:phage major capsid protein [Actinoplanes italicus]PRX23662.1 HK97 family phage major capsid protein [Actinoplanes italicus]GIE30164.1 phage capsid protein [Actinoplanes italicus]